MSEQTVERTPSHPHSIDDDTLTHQVSYALDHIEPLRALGSPIQVHVNDGVVMLRGVVKTHSIKVQAMQTAQGVPGVRQIQDEILTDFELETHIGHALATNPCTRPAAFDIMTSVSNGLVGLTGQVSNHTIAQTAETIVSRVPGVRAVSNRLQVRPKGDERNAHFA